MVARSIDPPVSVSVAPTETVLAVINTTNTAILAVEVQNQDAAQTLSCTIQRKVVELADWADSSLPDLSSIPPTESAAVDIDCGGSSSVRIVGVASGAGLTASICARDNSTGRR